VSLPDGEAEALALWVVFTYALEAFDVAPILALCSPRARLAAVARRSSVGPERVGRRFGEGQDQAG
jgi:hypothetical protein